MNFTNKLPETNNMPFSSVALHHIQRTIQGYLFNYLSTKIVPTIIPLLNVLNFVKLFKILVLLLIVCGIFYILYRFRVKIFKLLGIKNKVKSSSKSSKSCKSSSKSSSESSSDSSSSCNFSSSCSTSSGCIEEEQKE